MCIPHIPYVPVVGESRSRSCQDDLRRAHPPGIHIPSPKTYSSLSWAFRPAITTRNAIHSCLGPAIICRMKIFACLLRERCWRQGAPSASSCFHIGRRWDYGSQCRYSKLGSSLERAKAGNHLTLISKRSSYSLEGHHSMTPRFGCPTQLRPLCWRVTLPLALTG